MLEQILQSLGYIRPELALVFTFLSAIIADLVTKRKAIVAGIVLGGLMATAYYVVEQIGLNVSTFNNMLAIDPFSVFFKCVIVGSGIIIVMFSLASNEVNSSIRRIGEYYALLVAMTTGMFLMVGSSNLLMMYLSLELTSISSYILAGFTKEAPDSAEASLKYVIYGALSSGFMLYGISIIYGLTGALDIYSINQVLVQGGTGKTALLFAGVLAIAGFGYKISAVPFHFWTPDVYQGAPVTITAFLSVASKAAGFAMLMRFLKVTFVDPTVLSVPAGMWATLASFEWYNIVAAISV